MHTIRPEIWQETLKNNNAHFRTCNMSRKLKKKTWKMLNAHFSTLNVARKPKILEKCVTNNVLPGRWQETLTNVEYEKCTL